MNPYAVIVAPHPKSKGGWIVMVQFTQDSEYHKRRKGDKLARRYHYKKDADEAALDVLNNGLDNAPTFYSMESLNP